ncbi:MAG: exonuclease domain-containing protein [Alphaproteobacteria bacterium]
MLRGILKSLLILAAVLVAFAAWTVMTSLGAGLHLGVGEIVFAGLLVVAGLALWHAVAQLRRHRRELQRMRGAIMTLAGDSRAVLPRWQEGEVGAEVSHLYAAIADLAAARAAERAAPDRRLGAVLASISDGMVVITDEGQVSLVNHAAKALLDAERVRVGTSVFAALERASLTEAVEQARRLGQPVSVDLRTVSGGAMRARVADLNGHAGAILMFSGKGAEHRAEVEHDLELHDQPPPVLPVTAATLLADLPVIVLDTETTGLDVTQDRIVSVGAVRLHGGRMYRSAALDRLVQPGIAIPARSTAVHGITDAMVADAEDFPAVFARLIPLIEGTVLVGHNLPFDLAMLRGECRLAGIAWPEPLGLDTLLLASILDPEAPDHSLDGLAERFAVDVRGRHTALGDALVTAEIYARMLPRLATAGVTTFGAAQNFAARAKHIAARQRAAGW